MRFNDPIGIDIMSMAKPPVNSLSTELMTALKNSLLEAQENRSKGIILTSSLPTVFSAGLDIMEMYNSDVKGLTTFWHSFQDIWLTLNTLEVPTAAAINVNILPRILLLCIRVLFARNSCDNATDCFPRFIQGSSPAGGCMLAMGTEYRVFVEGKYIMGLNETQLGIVAPPWLIQGYLSLLGYRQAEKALLPYVNLTKTLPIACDLGFI